MPLPVAPGKGAPFGPSPPPDISDGAVESGVVLVEDEDEDELPLALAVKEPDPLPDALTDPLPEREPEPDAFDPGLD
jgi:hypothetical protein